MLTQYVVPVNEVLDMLETMKKGNSININSTNITRCDFQDNWTSEIKTSNKSHQFIRCDFPFTHYSTEIMITNQTNLYSIVTGKDLPPYSNTSRAIIDFLHLDYFDPYSAILNQHLFIVVIPDYRARIKKMKIMRGKIRIELECRAIKEEDVFAQFRIDEKKEVEISIKNLVAEVQSKNNPKEILAVILEKNKSEVLDYIDYTFRWTDSSSSIEKEIPEDIIRQWIDSGENDYVEFKEVLKHADDVMKSIVAFANTNGGVILVGVKDDCSIVGYDESIENTKNRLERMIAEKCDPPINFEIERVDLGEKITIIKIPKGSAKIYAVTNGPIYVRRGGSDRFIKPSEFTEFLDKNKTHDSSYTG